ncbi:chromate efflux transporter [Chachezhania antarctica]|uniref:chromate efflux transporter n=1 Tax=Chachezhania antarctica TaxID=2340860 RepID=UPI001F08DC2A|nr:chromate efflux transporter [Chachezhania antarctica]|tara:strand:+ start:4661 stop:5935 length:1275 start_codon:yes stop_codon:yes gene_type:complete
MTHETSPTLAQMTRVFGRIGLLSFGGPAAQIALMHRELVEERPWLDEPGFLRALSLCMLLPGPEAMQLATYAGWRLRGVTGGLIAGLLFVLPGAAVIAALALLYAAYGQVPLVQAAFVGVKAAVIVIVLQALRKLSARALTAPWAYGIAALAFIGIFCFDLPFPLIIAAAALYGFLTAPRPDTAPPPFTNSAGSTLRTAALWLALWLVPLLALTATGQVFLAQVGWFFAWLAVITFGGAYAVLSYITQTAVVDFGWISTAQMIDALGLAETTPGPLILVTQFVAMLAGDLRAGPWLGLAAGVVALWATFVPCFLWIFLAGPYVEQLAARPRLSAALQGITAAVVGVILNLSVWFALHVWFGEVGTWSAGPVQIPLPDPSTLQPLALALTALAALAMLRFKRGLAETLAVMAVLGIVAAAIPGAF